MLLGNFGFIIWHRKNRVFKSVSECLKVSRSRNLNWFTGIRECIGVSQGIPRYLNV